MIQLQMKQELKKELMVKVQYSLKDAVFHLLKENVPIMQQAGFAVGVWVWTFMVRGDKK